MTEADLAGTCRACPDGRRWAGPGRFLPVEAAHNGTALGLAGRRAMPERDVRAIPDLRFAVDLPGCEAPGVAARLLFDCHPAGRFLDLDGRARRIRFAENAFHGFGGGLVGEARSVIDRAAMAAHLR